jgi:hypothetical protein
MDFQNLETFVPAGVLQHARHALFPFPKWCRQHIIIDVSIKITTPNGLHSTPVGFIWTFFAQGTCRQNIDSPDAGWCENRINKKGKEIAKK